MSSTGMIQLPSSPKETAPFNNGENTIIFSLFHYQQIIFLVLLSLKGFNFKKKSLILIKRTAHSTRDKLLKLSSKSVK